jgi:predicted transcriptional regulator
MKLSEVIQVLDLRVLTPGVDLDGDVTGGYSSDLLSDVMAHASPGNLWLTLQSHPNVVAVGVLGNLAGVILTGGREPEPETIARARSEGLPLLATHLPTFEAVGRLHQALLGSGR